MKHFQMSFRKIALPNFQISFLQCFKTNKVITGKTLCCQQFFFDFTETAVKETRNLLTVKESSNRLGFFEQISRKPIKRIAFRKKIGNLLTVKQGIF